MKTQTLKPGTVFQWMEMGPGRQVGYRVRVDGGREPAFDISTLPSVYAKVTKIVKSLSTEFKSIRVAKVLHDNPLDGGACMIYFDPEYGIWRHALYLFGRNYQLSEGEILSFGDFHEPDNEA